MERMLKVCIAGLVLSLVAGGAQASGLRVSPVRLDVSGSHPSAELTLTNLTNINSAVQVEVMEWKQTNGKEELLPTKDVVFAPPITIIPASQAKKLRFNVRVAPDANVERTYRVVVKEIEPPQQDEDSGVGMKMMLRISLPLFMAPEKRIGLGFVSRLTQERGGPVVVSLQNTGNAHIRVQAIELYPASFDPKSSDDSGKIAVSPLQSITASVNDSPYILVGGTQTWQLPAALLKPGAEYWLLARTDCYRSRTVPVNRYGFFWQKLIVAPDGSLSSEIRSAG